MTKQVSIWRWAVTDDLEALFARLIAAEGDAFAAQARELIGHEEAPDEMAATMDVFRQTEDKIRAMGLPKEEMDTTLAGLKSMIEEMRAEQAAARADEEEEFAPDPSGRIGAALASSHLFFDDPYASLPYEEIERQVGTLVTAYRSAISKAVGHAGQDLDAYLGLDPAEIGQDDLFDALMEHGLDGVMWVWPLKDHMFFLSQWHEDKELPIDLDFSRAPLGIFEAFKARL